MDVERAQFQNCCIIYIKTASNYDKLVLNELKYKLKDVRQFLDIAQHDLHYYSKDRYLRDELRKDLFLLENNNEKSINDQLNNWLILIKKTSDVFSAQPDLFSTEKKEIRKLGPRSTRIRYIMKDILKLENSLGDENDPLLFAKISEFVESLFKEAIGKMKSRPTSLFLEALRNVFEDGDLPDLFDVMEFEEQIVSINKTSLSIPYLIQNSIYIDTPMMIGVDSENEHWDDLNELLIKPGKLSFANISKTISKDIIHGDVSVDDSTDFYNDFSYKSEDGSIYNLLDCATGVKSFGILQLLLKNGSLSDKTLLIIDEPESHLHPQWIIEYAHLIVLLNKIVGIKFFIASHNPDMVSAIKHIADKEKISDNLNFYIAEKREGKYIYDYKHLGSDIDPIFKSFNIALERIHHYGK